MSCRESILRLIRERELSSASVISRESLDSTMEESFIDTHRNFDYPLISSVVLSTIAIAISPDGTKVATTHGDHTVKIFRHETGEQIKVFRGHPRTPWTVKFHPIISNFVASGCLGCEVRVWDIAAGACRSIVRYDYSIISLAFQPHGPYIAVASGPQLYMWDWDGMLETSQLHSRGPAPRSRLLLTHSRNIRAIMFHPHGDLAFAAAPDPPRLPNATSTPCRLYAFICSELLRNYTSEPFALDSLPALIPQVHLYSDGGIDISADGKHVFTCAILFVPPNRAESPTSPVGHSTEELATDRMLLPHYTSSLQNSTQSNLLQTALTFGDHAALAFRRYLMPHPQNYPQQRVNEAPVLRAADPHIQTRTNHPSSADPAISDCRRNRPDDSNGVPFFADPLNEERPPQGWHAEEHVCLFKLVFSDGCSVPSPHLVQSKSISGTLMRAVTSVKLSPSVKYGLIGYGVRSEGAVEHHAHRKVACEIMRLSDMSSECVMSDDVDEVNIAQFHPFPGCGIIYGTKRGKVRVFLNEKFYSRIHGT